MRSFSKKLAFVLAAAMVVTAFAPAAKAEAAKEMAINKSSQILYVNEGINHKGGEVAAPGKGNVSVYDFSVKNKPADWKTAYSFAWSSSDEDVVSVAKGGVATAVGVGKATVYCKVTEKATKEVTTLKTKVTVKANADKVEISNADKWDGATVEVGGVVDLNRTMYDENGNKATSRTKGCVTDYTKWVAEPAAGVEIDQKTGKFTFTEDAVAGEYKLSCYTYQSSKYTEKTAESDVVVVEFVKADKFEVDQTASNAFNLVFGKEANFAIADVSVNKIIAVGDSTGKLVVPVSNVVFSEDKKTASVSFFNNFDNGATYEVAVKGYEEAVTFVASYGKPESMTISSNSQIQGGACLLTNNIYDLTYKLFDKDGNDVTNTVSPYTTYISYSAADLNTADYYVSGNSLCIYKNGAQVLVNAEFHTGEFDEATGMENVIKATGLFLGMDKAPDSIAEVSFNLTRWGNPAYANRQIPVNDYDVALELKIKTTAPWDQLNKYAAGAPITKIDTTGGVNPQRVRFRSTTPDVLDVDKTDLNKINIFKEGSAAILADLVSFNADGTEKVVSIAAIYVTVIPKRVVTNITAGNGTVIVGDTVVGDPYAPWNQGSVTLTINDQYGEAINVNAGKTVLTDVKFALDNTPVPEGSVVFVPRNQNTGWQNLIVVNDSILGNNFVYPAGQNQVTFQLSAKVKVLDEHKIDYAEREIRFRVIVKKPVGQEIISLEVGKDTNGNVGRFVTPYDGNKNNENQKTVSFAVFGTQNGVKVNQKTLLPKPTNNVVAEAYATSSAIGTLFYSVTHNGQDITAYTYLDANNQTILLDYSALKAQNMYNADGSFAGNNNMVIYKTDDGQKDLGAGNYVFTLYKVAANAANNRYIYAYADSRNVNVTVDTGSYTLVRRTFEAATHNNNGVAFEYDTTLENTPQYGIWNSANHAAIRDCFEIKNRDGQNATTPFFVDAVEAENYIHVKSITFFESLEYQYDSDGDGVNDATAYAGQYAPYTVNINVSIKK